MKNRKSSKENASRLFNWYIWLVDLIYRAGKITFEQINEKWIDSSHNEQGDELPLKTFHNHRIAVQQMFDIDIICNRRAGFVYYIDNKDDMERGGVRSWLLNTFAINNLINESHKLKHRILFEHVPSGQEYLTTIIEAMRDNKMVEITYKSFWRDLPSTFEIEPYCVKVFKQRWYVVAKTANHESPRIYALDRILGIEESENKFTVPEDFDAEEYFYNSHGIIIDDEYDAEFVKIKAYDNQAAFLRALPLHHSQEEIETKEEYSVFKYYIKPTFDFRQALLTFGESIEVLSPNSFRNEFIDIAKNMCNRYD